MADPRDELDEIARNIDGVLPDEPRWRNIDGTNCANCGWAIHAELHGWVHSLDDDVSCGYNPICETFAEPE